MEKTVAAEWIFIGLWFMVGAYVASLGTTASHRVTRFGTKGEDGDRDSELVGDSVFHTLGRLLVELLQRSRCDGCRRLISIEATFPLWGARVKCSNPKCEYSGYKGTYPERLKYFFAELSGGWFLAVVWLILGRSMQNMLTLMLLLFLSCFLVSMKNSIYRAVVPKLNVTDFDENQLSQPDQVDVQQDSKSDSTGGGQSQTSQQHGILTAGIGIAVIGWALPIDANYQHLGMALWGWIGWIIGLWYAGPKRAAISGRKEVPVLIAIRCFVCGLIAGAWFGVVLGSIVCAIAFGIAVLRLWRTREYRVRYVEESLLFVSILMVVGIVAMVHTEVGTEILEVAGVMETKFDVYPQLYKLVHELL